MKALFAAVLLVSSIPAFAKNSPRVEATPELVAQFPATLKCTSGAFSSAVKAFTLDNMNTLQPEASILDQGRMENTQTWFDSDVDLNVIDLGFSNECDNGYGVQFYAEDLIALNAGSITQVLGLLDYNDVEVWEATNGLVKEEKAVLTCTK